MDAHGQFGGLRFLDARELKGATVFDVEGASLGSVAAVLARLDGAVDLLVREGGPRWRALRVALDDVEIDDQGRLWRRPGWRVYRIGVPAPAESLTER